MDTPNEHDAEVAVLVVGGGPAGLSAALALGRLGVGCVLVERRPDVGGHPRATGVRTRTMELFRAWGIADAVEREALAQPEGSAFAWVHTIAGEEFGRLVVGADVADRAYRAAASPARTVFCPQDRLEPILLDAVRAQPSVGVRLGTEVRELEQDAGAVAAVMRDTHTGVRRRLRARYVLACDGAGSSLRAAVGVPMTGPDLAVSFVSIYFEADLRPWVGAVPPVLHWIMNTRSSGGLVSLDGRHRWLFQAAQLPDEDPPSPEWSARVVRDAVGVPDLDVTVGRVLSWRMSAQVADRFRAGDVFLVGDAAHRFPPTGGFGMNTSIQDAHNLAWKLHAVLDGWAGTGLLDSYETERRPVAEFNTAQSHRNLMNQARTGFGPDVYAVAKELETGTTQARRRIVDALPQLRPEFDGLGQDLGIHYDAGAFVPDGTATPARTDLQLDYVPRAAPGARAPHHPLWRGSRRLSTLDLYGESFVLLAAAGGRGWVDAAGASALARAVPLAGYRLGDDGDLVDLARAWPALYGVGTCGACLVRPDGHVAWRTAQAPGLEAERVLGDVLDRVLSRT